MLHVRRYSNPVLEPPCSWYGRPSAGPKELVQRSTKTAREGREIISMPDGNSLLTKCVLEYNRNRILRPNQGKSCEDIETIREARMPLELVINSMQQLLGTLDEHKALELS